MPKVITTPMVDIVIGTGAYTINDALGGLVEIDVPKNGVIMGVVIVDRDSEEDALDIIFFDRSVTVAADHDPAAYSDDDLQFCLGQIKVVAGDYGTFAANSLATVDNQGFAYETTSGHLFFQCVTRATPTYTAASDVQIRFSIVVG